MEKRQWVRGRAKNMTHGGLPVDLCGRRWKQRENASEGLAWEARLPASPLTEILDARDAPTAGRENELDL